LAQQKKNGAHILLEKFGADASKWVRSIDSGEHGGQELASKLAVLGRGVKELEVQINQPLGELDVRVGSRELELVQKRHDGVLWFLADVGAVEHVLYLFRHDRFNIWMPRNQLLQIKLGLARDLEWSMDTATE
jgi:hypothetical protein